MQFITYRFLSFLCILLALPFSSFALTEGNESELDCLFSLFKRAARFDYDYPREKVYVHLDNSAYMVNDTIWYKVYVVRASSLQPTELSRVAYVELLNADGLQIEKQTLKLDSLGTANGSFVLKQPIYAGFHELRAYTREMVNWGESACFSRVLPIFSRKNAKESESTDDADITQLFIPKVDETSSGLGCPRPYRMTDSHERQLSFYPEGGLRAKGLPQRIAYKITDGRGYAVDDTIKIYYADGTFCTKTQPLHDGMGTIVLPSDYVKGYADISNSSEKELNKRRKKVLRNRVPLPVPIVSYALRADVTDDGLQVQVIGTDSLYAASPLLAIAVFNRENACYFDTLTLSNAAELLVPRKALRGGVNRLELFSAEHGSLASRMFWIPLTGVDSLRHSHVQVVQNEEEYAPFSPAVVKVRVSDHEGHPIKNANLSIAVRDEAGNILDTYDGGMESQLLLSSELRGYIHRPDLYFSKNDARHQRMLDLLMLVQGWCANTFDVMSGREKFETKQPIEEKMLVRGHIYRDNSKKEPYPQVSLSMRAYQYENDSIKPGTLVGNTVSDKYGAFSFEAEDFYGDYIAQFIMRGGKKNKKQWSRLAIDRWFEPTPRPLYEPELTLHPYTRQSTSENVLTNDAESRVATFEWQDTIPRALPSVTHEAVVEAKVRKYKGFTGNKFTWGGGEAFGVRNALHYYDVQRLMERLKDSGLYSKINFYQLLALLENNYVYDFVYKGNDNIIDMLNNNEDEHFFEKYNRIQTSNKEKEDDDVPIQLFYKGHAMKLYKNNEETSYINLEPEEIKSIAFMQEKMQENAISDKDKLAHGKPYALYVYEMPKAYRILCKKGKEYRHLSGFAHERTFFSPNYRRFDMPTEKDVRRTLYWIPKVTTDANGEANIIFFSNAHEEQTLDISVRGISKDGLLIERN